MMLLPQIRQLGAVLALTLSLTLLGGCEKAGPEAAYDGKRVVIDFWNGFTGPDGKTMTAMVQRFEAANPDVEVKMQIIPWATYYDKLTLSMAYGGAPDVFVVQSSRFPEFASYQTLRPLVDLYASDAHPLEAQDFVPTPWRESSYDGTLYALPLDTWPAGLYYNTKLFREAGIVDAQGNARPPTNLVEFLDDAKRLTRDTDGDGRPDQWGFVFTDQHNNWLTFADQFGGGIVGPDGRTGEMSSPPSLQASRLMCDLIYKYRVAPRPEGVDSWLLFREGKAAMAIQGIYMLADLEQTPGLEFAGAPVPQFGPHRGVWGGSHLLCQPTGIDAAHARAGWRLMRYLSDHSLTWGIGGQVPARRDVERSAAFQALPVQSQFAKELDYVIYEPQIPKANSLNQFVDPAIGDTLDELQTPEAAMRDADRRIDQLLRRP